MAKIQLPHLSTELAGMPTLEGALRNVTNNLRSGVWEPPEISEWLSGISDLKGKYQLVGQICFIDLFASATSIHITTTEVLPLPVAPYIRTSFNNIQYQHILGNQILVGTGVYPLAQHNVRYDMRPDMRIGISTTNNVTTSGDFLISGWYWVKG